MRWMRRQRPGEANTPLGRAVIGGLLAGLVTTLFVVPALYSLVVRDRPVQEADEPPTPPDATPGLEAMPA